MKMQNKIAELLNAEFYLFKCDVSGRLINFAYYIPSYDIYIDDDAVIIKSSFYDYIYNHDLLSENIEAIKHHLINDEYLQESDAHLHAGDDDGYILFNDGEVLTIPEAIDLLSDNDKLKIWG